MHELTLGNLVDAGSDITLGKTFYDGTHREFEPGRLLDSLKPELPRFGISRIARITDLDRIGIEVYTIVRPNSYGLSVTQGKGIGQPAAKLSGIMEAIECWHAEQPENALFLASLPELGGRWPDTPIHLWSSFVERGKRVLWTFATHLVTGDETPVPFDLVHANFQSSARLYASGFLVSTNGLASGGNLPEAVTHGLCEVIERHATAEFGLLSAEARAARVLDLGSIDDPRCQALIKQCSDADVGLKIWDTTCKISVPCFVACLSDEVDIQMPPGFGAGCHLSRGVALSRAITEAAQSRLTRISGARDDLASKFYGKAERTRARFLTEKADGAQFRSFSEIPDCTSDCLVKDFRTIMARLGAAGHHDAFAVTLAHGSQYCVVRTIVPSLRGLEDES